MTQRLYYTDAYLTAFDAHVVDLAEGGRRAYLDRTAFYPTSGGQPHDLGTLGGVPVVDVVDEGERIAHVLEAPLAAGQVHGEIAWDRRLDHMRQHTGQHLLSAVCAELFGWETVSVHFGPEASTVDLDTAAATREQLQAIERQANAVVMENRPVHVSFEEASGVTGLRKPTDRTGEVRIVTIAGLDRSACGGTHVRATGEIGPILLRRTERIRKQVRVEFVCGLRAVAAAQADCAALLALAEGFSAAPADLPALVAAQRDQLRAADAERRRLEGEVAAHRARALYDGIAPDARGRRVLVQAAAGPVEDLRPLATAFAALPGAVFIAAGNEPPAILMASADDTGVDAGAAVKAALAAAGGRGGGSPRLAQGRVPDAAATSAVLEFLRHQS